MHEYVDEHEDLMLDWMLLNRFHRHKVSLRYELIYDVLSFLVDERHDHKYHRRTVFHLYEYAKERKKKLVEISSSSISIINEMSVNLWKYFFSADTHTHTHFHTINDSRHMSQLHQTFLSSIAQRIDVLRYICAYDWFSPILFFWQTFVRMGIGGKRMNSSIAIGW